MSLANTQMANNLNLPALSMPINSENVLGSNIEVCGMTGDDRLVMAIGKTFEKIL